MSCEGTIFNHSVPVPRIYKIASKVAKNAKSGQSLKNLVYNEKHVNIKTLYALVVETFKRDVVIEELLEKSQLLTKEPRFDPWLAKILICEMLWGKNKMRGDSKPLQTILGYEKLLKTLLSDCTDVKRDVLKHNVLKPRYARVNTLKITVEEAINNFRDDGWNLVKYFNYSDYEGFLERLNNLESNEFMIDIHIPELLIFPPKTEFHNHEAYKSKCIILQDKASCLPVFLLNPSPGATVIDMCAAPGMKTTQLAAMLNNSGKVYAVELDKNRAMILTEVVEASGATCVKTILKDVMQINDDDCPDVEYILVDPSCTGSGITDRVEIDDPDFHDRIGRLKKLCNFQAKLLRHATTAFPKAKRIVYSTCSINAEENEDVVRQILETCKNFKLIDAKKLLKSWNDTGSEVFPVLGKMCVYATPEKDKTNGFFIAVLERLGEGEINPYLNVELCKLYDRGKKIKKNHNQGTNEELIAQNINQKKSQQIEVKHETNPSNRADQVHLQINNHRNFKQENEVMTREHHHIKTENVENITKSDIQSDGKKKKKNYEYNSYNSMNEKNIDEPENIKIKKTKLQESEPENVDENVKHKELNQEFNETDKQKKKKRKKITSEKIIEILEDEHLEENDRNKILKKEPYEEIINNEIPVDISKSLEHENLPSNKNKISEKKQCGQRENKGSVEILNDGVTCKKIKKKRKNIEESLIESENKISIGISCEDASSSEHNTKNKFSTSPLSTEVLSSTKKQKKQERALLKHNETEISMNISVSNKKITNKKRKMKQDAENVEDSRDVEKSQNQLEQTEIENSELIHTKKQLNQCNESVNDFQNKDSLIDHSETDNIKLKKKKKKYSEELLTEIENQNLTIEDCEDLKLKKKKKKKQIDICKKTGNEFEKKETLINNSKAEKKRYDESFIGNENSELKPEDCEDVKLKKKNKKKRKETDVIYIESENEFENENVTKDINLKKKKKKHLDESFGDNEKIDLTIEDCENVKLKKNKKRKLNDISNNNDKANSDNLLEISYMNEDQNAMKNRKVDVAIYNETENSNGNNKIRKKKQMLTDSIEVIEPSASNCNLVEKVFLDSNGKLKKIELSY